MRRDDAGRLNKEKLVFLGAALLLSCALYFFFSSGPLPLVLAPPATREAGPEAIENVPQLRANKSIDALVDNGEPRLSPFEPFRQHISPGGGGGGVVVKSGGPATMPPDDRKPKDPVVSSVPAIASEVDYVGVVIDGKPRALIKPRNGAASFLVAEGESIPHYSYTVSKIEPQAIEIRDSDNRPFTLKDQTFEKSATTRAR